MSDNEVLAFNLICISDTTVCKNGFIIGWNNANSPTMSDVITEEHAIAWWRHKMETFSALLALCAGNSPVTGESPSQRPVTQSFDTFFDLRLNKRVSKESWGWRFDTPSRSAHYDVPVMEIIILHNVLYLHHLCPERHNSMKFESKYKIVIWSRLHYFSHS